MKKMLLLIVGAIAAAIVLGAVKSYAQISLQTLAE